MHRKGNETFFLPGRSVTEARIYLLSGEEGSRSADDFPNYDRGGSFPVYGFVSLKDERLENFIDLWQSRIPSYYVPALCHAPAYGVRLCHEEKLVVETGLCWECDNFTIAVWPDFGTTYGFLSQTEEARRLLAFCDSLLPYHRSSVTEDAGLED